MIYKTRKPNRELLRSFHEFWDSVATEYRLPPISDWIDDAIPMLYLYEVDPGGRLMGLCLIQCPDDEPWIYILVDKTRLRQNTASRLLEAAQKTIKAPEIYFLAGSQPNPGTHEFLNASGFTIFSRECIMELKTPHTISGAALSIETLAHEDEIVSLSACMPEDFHPVYETCFGMEFQPDEGNYYKILSKDQVLLGGVALTPYQNGWFLFDLCILPKHRRHGYAAAAIAAALRQPLPTGAMPDRILLHVSSANHPAYTLYQKTGFTTIEENTLYTLTI